MTYNSRKQVWYNIFHFLLYLRHSSKKKSFNVSKIQFGFSRQCKGFPDQSWIIDGRGQQRWDSLGDDSVWQQLLALEYVHMPNILLYTRHEVSGPAFSSLVFRWVLLSLVCCLVDQWCCCWFVVWWKEDLPGLSIRCYTRGLIGGSPRRRRQTETVKEEEPQLLFCADNQICMISGWTGFSSFLMLAPKGALHAIIGQFPLSPALVSA